MTTREALERLLKDCERTLEYARAQFIEGSRLVNVEQVDGYTEAQQMLEDRYNELMAMYRSANAQQREQLDRMRLAIQSLQNEMILKGQQMR